MASHSADEDANRNTLYPNKLGLARHCGPDGCPQVPRKLALFEMTKGTPEEFGLGGGPTRAKLDTGFFAFLGPLNATVRPDRVAKTPYQFR